MQTPPPLPVKLDRGIHVLHLFYRLNRARWEALPPGESGRSLERLQALWAAKRHPSHPRLDSFAGLGAKADLAFMLLAADALELGRMHRLLETCFPTGTLQQVYSYLSVTELSEYASTEADFRQLLIQQEKLVPESAEFQKRLEELNRKRAEYEHYRLYPELPEWEVMGFYPMSKRRAGVENWYALDFEARKKLMGGHARTGRKFAGRVTQLITGSVGLDDWEWGVTLVAHQLDALKEIVYEMRFDEVSARYGEFGPFYLGLRMVPEALWEHVGLGR